MKANTVRITKDFFRFTKLNQAKLAKVDVVLTSILMRAQWGFNKDTQPQSQYYNLKINEALTLKPRRRKLEDITLTMSGTEFFKHRPALKNITPWIRYRIAILILRHNKSGNVYKVEIKGRRNLKTDTREGFVMEMNGKKHTKLTKIEIAEMFDDLKPITLGDPCHYNYHGARTVMCDLKK